VTAVSATIEKVRRDRKQFLTGSAVTPAVRPDVLQSWNRSLATHGVNATMPEIPQTELVSLDDQLTSRLAQPLEGFAESLEGTGLGLLLADARGRILRRWCPDSRSRRHFDKVHTVRGAVLAESAVGTNGVGTPLETGRLTQIRGPEHFIDMYQRVVCTGAPVRDPLTGETVGVLTISCELAPHTGLLIPLLSSAVHMLEQHILEGSHPSSRRLFAAFLSASRRTDEPVIALGDETFIATPNASQLFDSHDVAWLRELASGARTQLLSTVSTVLPSGRRVHVTCDPIEGAGAVLVIKTADEAILHIESFNGRRPAASAGRSVAWLRCLNDVETLRASSVPLLITGEPGSGKTTVALGQPFGLHEPTAVTPQAYVLDAGMETVNGTRRWLSQLQRALAQPGLTVVRHLESLSLDAARGICSILDSSPRVGNLIATAVPNGTDTPISAPLRQRFGSAFVQVPPLRQRIGDVPVLLDTLMSRHAHDGRMLDFTREALDALVAYSWPGNVRELEGVVQRLIASNPGPITTAHLPWNVGQSAGRPLTAMEHAELSAIQQSLAQAGGNRVQAAQLLGISRATLYRKLRAYHLEDR
jgi:transcriptional regulator of acetoin/glycerol metabolism